VGPCRAACDLVVHMGVDVLPIIAATEGIRGAVDWLSAPQRLFPLAVAVLATSLIAYRRWTRPPIAACLGAVIAAAYIAALCDAVFFRAASRPDSVPITLLLVMLAVGLWIGLRRAALNDQRRRDGLPLLEGRADNQVLTWPHLLAIELVATLICMTLLLVWSILVRAPLEPPASPYTAPNPAKAPWYFLGLQELLVYFDPWIAGVLVPVLIVLGLCAIPYLDRNPNGNGYYTLRERPFAVALFLSGFVLLWLLPIIVGTVLRGPNWACFGPFESWDPHRPALTAHVNLSELFWVHGLGRTPPEAGSGAAAGCILREAPGLCLLVLYFLLPPWLLKRTVFRATYPQMGLARYAIAMFLLAAMFLVPIKMLLRWCFNLKYIVTFTEWSLSI